MSLSTEKIALITALETYGKTIDLEIRHGETIYTSENIVSCSISFEGGLLTSIMKQAEIELDGVGGPDFAESMKGERLFITLIVNGEETATKEYGTFIVKDAEYKDETNSIILTCYDLMLLAMTEYNPVIDFPKQSSTEENTEGEPETTTEEGTEEIPPVTLGIYLQAMCNSIGVVLATPTFANSEVIIDEEKYDNTYTKRDVFTEIAQAAAGTIAIKDDELYVLYPTESEVKIEPSNLKTIEIGEKYGPVNSVVIARTPQEDNIFKMEENAENICEIKIENNQLMDSHREDFIEEIYNALYGLTYYPHEVESFGIGVLDVCDFFTIETLDGKTYTSLHLSGEIEITQGLLERTKGTAPAATETDYKAASTTDRVVNQTILRVDKQEGEIQGLITSTKQTENKLTGELETVKKSVNARMDDTSLKLLIEETVNGKDSITTSTGYTFDKNGLLIGKSDSEVENLINHEGMYVRPKESNGDKEDNILTADKEGVNAINLTARQYLTIGGNSRFEDYGENRTACFYIGG